MKLLHKMVRTKCFHAYAVEVEDSIKIYEDKITILYNWMNKDVLEYCIFTIVEPEFVREIHYFLLNNALRPDYDTFDSQFCWDYIDEYFLQKFKINGKH